MTAKNMHLNTKFAKLLPLLSITLLSACSWVDSTGVQGDERTTFDLSPTNDSTRNTEITDIVANIVTTLNENTSNPARIIEQEDNLAATPWSWSLEREDRIELCNSAEGFDSQFAATSLIEACTDTTSCTVSIVAAEGNSDSDVVIDIPRLKAPIALRYALSALNEDGTNIERQQVLCAIPINEAPDTKDDNYLVIAGSDREVKVDDIDNLLANDSDDKDSRNVALSVKPELISKPAFASQFNLNTDGSFSYTTDPSLVLRGNQTLTDSFTYLVSDGVFEVEATANILIVRSNTAPQAIGDLPDMLLTREIESDSFIKTINLDDYFQDSDTNPLYYYVNTEALPADVYVTVNEAGILNVITQSNTDNPVTGDWYIDITVSDGLDTANSGFLLSIENSAALANNPPQARQIPNLQARNQFRYDASVFFSDPDEGDSLTFTSEGLPVGVELSSDGIMRRTSNDDIAGTYTPTFTATDSFGLSASSQFTLVIF